MVFLKPVENNDKYFALCVKYIGSQLYVISLERSFSVFS